MEVIEQSCGACRECCIYHDITADGEDEVSVRKYISNGADRKPAKEPCPQLNKAPYTCYNCNIYNAEDKPKTCSSYKCAYLLGVFGSDKRLRPDNLGTIFDIKDKHVRATETRHNALNNKLVKQTLYYLTNASVTSMGDDTKVTIIPYVLLGKETSVCVTDLSLFKKKTDEPQV